MTISGTIQNGTRGLWIGNKIMLPFHANYLKFMIDGEILSDFSKACGVVEIKEYEHYTSLYFVDYDDFTEAGICLVQAVAVEKQDDIFSLPSHRHIELSLENDGSVIITHKK